MTENFRILKSVRIDRKAWELSDLRIDIPPMSFGSDASNPHTQYSNAVAQFELKGILGVGACFTLGEGNQYVCAATNFILGEFDGLTLGDLLKTNASIGDVFSNPRQLRWISPNAGLPLMAAGLVLNTVIDYASKRAGLPAWKFLAGLEFDEFISLISTKHIRNRRQLMSYFRENWLKFLELTPRIEELEEFGLPTYFTTWIGADHESLVNDMKLINKSKGITKFKIKIGSDIDSEKEKIDFVINNLPDTYRFAADANQKLDFETAQLWLDYLSERNFLWLEEPFAPDNILLFRDLKSYRSSKNLSSEIASGENCPNIHTAQALCELGIDAFQPDPCRMMGITDALFAGLISRFQNVRFIPHAGGAGLDELSPHLQFFYLARIDRDMKIEDSLTESIGFASKFYAAPSTVNNGKIGAPQKPGLLVGLSEEVTEKMRPFTEGTTWLKL